MVKNRIGDFGITSATRLIFITFRLIGYATIFAIVPFFIKSNLIF